MYIKERENNMKYTIPTYKLKMVLKKLDELNKRITGMEGQRIEYTVSPSYQKTVDFIEKENIIQKLVDVVDIDVTNPMVSLNGWSFLAVIEHSKKGNIIMKKLYDVEIPEQYLTSDTYCEHCNTDRYRKFTYLVYKADTKEIHQVGSTCLTAYLGFDASLLLAHATFFTNLNGMMDDDKVRGRMGRRGIEIQEIELFLKQTIAWVQKFGYVSAKKAREDNEKYHNDENHRFLTATGYDVWALKYAKTQQNCILDIVNTDEVKKIYENIINWVKGLENTSDYIHNIKVIVDRGYVTDRTATTAASIVGVYFANLNKNKVEDKTVSNHFGTIGERIDVDLILKRRTVFEGAYGISHCYTFLTNEGNTATWFTASANLEEGKKYTGKATVTKHTEFKGMKQTVLNRCKLTEVIE